jgi:hypothetical protein
LDDAQAPEFSDPLATPYYLTLIAQEEFAKGFLLALVERGVIPWHPLLLRAARDHTCKQLLCVVMDHLVPDDDQFMERVRRYESAQMPAKVADALNILRHEKIGRWADSHWVWAEDPEYHAGSVAIAKGEQDRQKQDALYVRLAADGGVASVPTAVNDDTIAAETERARRFARLTEGVLAGEQDPGLDYSHVEESFRLLFASIGRSSEGA